jgi:hypothetical protein
MKAPSRDELLKQNPQIDPKRLDDAVRLATQLRNAGVQGARYALATPATGRRQVVTPSRKTLGPHSHSLVRRH